MHRYDDDDDFSDDAEPGDDSLEALVWQLLLLINPGDEETALRQFAAFRDAIAESGDTDEPMEAVAGAIDWSSGFRVDASEPRVLVQALDELTARWNLAIDWDGDPDDDEFLEDNDVPALLATAADRLAEHGYTVWTWETPDDSYAGWITRTHDDEPMRELATALGINLRLARDAS